MPSSSLCSSFSSLVLIKYCFLLPHQSFCDLETMVLTRLSLGPDSSSCALVLEYSVTHTLGPASPWWPPRSRGAQSLWGQEGWFQPHHSLTLGPLTSDLVSLSLSSLLGRMPIPVVWPSGSAEETKGANTRVSLGTEPSTGQTLSLIGRGRRLPPALPTLAGGPDGQGEHRAARLWSARPLSDPRAGLRVERRGFSDSGSGLPEPIRGVRQMAASSTQANRRGGRQTGQPALTLNPNAPAHICS